MNGKDYAEKIIDLVNNKEIAEISKVLEEFEVECFIRQYSNLKEAGITYQGYYARSFDEIKNDLELFKNEINNNCKSKGKILEGDKGILKLISQNIYPSKIKKTYKWIVQLEHFFKDCSYYKEIEDTKELRKYLKNNEHLKKILNHKHLKGLCIYYLPMQAKDRMSSVFFYDKAIARYGCKDANIIPLVRGTIAAIGEMYYIPTIRHGNIKNDENFKKLVLKLSELSGNERIIDMEERTIFGDLFSVYIMQNDTKEFSLKNLGYLFYLFYNDNSQKMVNEIVNYFENIIENDKIVEMPEVDNGLKKFLRL